MSSDVDKTPTTKKPANFKTGIFFLIVSLVFLIFLPGLSLVLFIGLLPTLGAIISDPTETRAQAFCVGVCNIAGLAPSIHELYSSKFSMKAAYTLIHNEINLLIILCAAAIGWVIFFTVPVITTIFYKSRDRSTLQKLVRRYDELKETWGDAVASSSAIENLRSKSSK